MTKHAPILEEHRIAPDWGSMSADARAEHWTRLWGYYGVFDSSIDGRPDREAVQVILDLHTPPELAQKYRYPAHR